MFVVLIGSKYTHFRNREVSLVRKHSLGVRGKKKNWKQEKAITGFNSKCSVQVTKKKNPKKPKLCLWRTAQTFAYSWSLNRSLVVIQELFKELSAVMERVYIRTT